MTNSVTPDTSFNWGRYRDATLAGLSVLIPIPLVDWIFESFFRRRMPGRIARQRQRRLDPAVIDALNRGERTCLQTCLTLPLVAVFELIKRISRKILYFLAIKEATDKLSYYWHEAFLIDYMLLSGQLDSEETAQTARQAMQQVLRTGTTTSPFRRLAGKIIDQPFRIFRSLRRARQDQEDRTLEEKRTQLLRNWAEVADYLAWLAKQYDQAYEQVRRQQQAALSEQQ